MAKTQAQRDFEGRVQHVLRFHFGRRRAIRGWEIAEKLGMGKGEHAVSKVRVAVRGLKREKHVIVAATSFDDDGNQPGYFYANTAAEYQRFAGPFRSRALDILETHRLTDEGAEELWGTQSRLDQMGTGQLEMPLQDADEVREAGGPLWWEVDAQRSA